jgi:hypothetical protein
VQTGIGTTLREARNRRKVELSEVERAIKIRARYLRAMENEEWGVLPGGPYTRGFIRTYANFLGLDGDRLADDYRRSEGAQEAPAGEGAMGIEPLPGARSRPRSGLSGWVWIAAVSVALVAIMVAVGLAGGGDDGSEAPGPAKQEAAQDRSREEATQVAERGGVAVEVEARGEVWVCLLDVRGEPLIDGAILEAGAVEGPFRSEGFTAAFGNGEVTIQIDGREAETPSSSSPIGFEIDSEGELRELEEGQRPDCE